MKLQGEVFGVAHDIELQNVEIRREFKLKTKACFCSQHNLKIAWVSALEPLEHWIELRLSGRKCGWGRGFLGL